MATTPTVPDPLQMSQQMPQSAENGGDQGWQNAAQGAAAPKPPAPPAGGAASSQPAAPGTATPAPPPPVTTVAAPPAEAKRIPRPGLGGFIDKMVDSLAGTDTSKVRQDAQGNVYIDHPALTRGQQWLRIGAEALLGAGAGMAQRGAGSKGAALGAGMQAGMQFKQEQQQAPTQELTQLANISALNHQTAANALELTRKGIEGQQHDVEFSEKQADRLTGGGATMAGHAANLQDLTKFMRETPQFNQDQVKTAMYTPVATYGADGKPNGFDIYKKLPGSDDEMLPAGTHVPFFNPVKNEIEYQKSAGPLKQGDVNALWAAAGNARHKYQLDQSEIEDRNATAQEKLHPQAKPETPSATAEHQAQTRRANAGADLDEQKKLQIKTGAALPDGTPNPRFETMANAMLSGDILPGDLKREAKGASLDPNEVMGRAMEIAQTRGEHFSLPIIEQEHKFASSPKTQAALDGMDRILGSSATPGYLDRMLETAKKAHLASGPLAGAGNNLMLATRRYFGEHTAKDLNTQIEDARSAIQGLIGNPLLGGGETDKKLEQAQRMLGASPTMENLTSAAGILKTALQTQRQSIVGNNRYLRQRYGSSQPPQQQGAPTGLTSLHTNPQTQQTIGWNGQAWVDTKTGQAVK